MAGSNRYNRGRQLADRGRQNSGPCQRIVLISLYYYILYYMISLYFIGNGADNNQFYYDVIGRQPSRDNTKYQIIRRRKITLI